MAYVKIENGLIVQKQPNPRDGFIEAPDSVVCGMAYDGEEFSSPPSPNHTWSGTEWVLDTEAFTESLTTALKTKRDELWQSATVTLGNGAVLKVNDRTRKDISDTYDGMMAAGMETYAGWNAGNGRYDMTLADFQEAKVKGLQVVAKAFGAYNTVIDTHDETPYTDIDQALNTLVNIFNTEE